MTKPKLQPYGTWRSPITSDLIVAGAIGIDDIEMDGDDFFWNELRPKESGRVVIVKKKPNGDLADRTPPPFNARTRAHEYGGGAWVVADDTVYFSNFADQRLYRHTGSKAPQPLTPEADMRYADARIDKQRNRLICVREVHSESEAVNEIVAVDLGSGETKVLAAGNDFYSTPRLNPDGSKLAWLTWHHPNMPWDGTELWVADIDKNGSLKNQELVAGSDTESVFQPEWSPAGVLHFVSDRSGWWNIYRQNAEEAENLAPRDSDFGYPQWVFGLSMYAFTRDGQIVCTFFEDGISHLAVLDTEAKSLELIATPYTDISSVKAKDNRVIFRGGAPNQPAEFVSLDLQSREIKTIYRATELSVDAEYLSTPNSIEFETGGGKTAHALFYPPKNPEYEAPEGEYPPLIVKSHGGPTSAAGTALNMRIQYWTSRGFGVVDVNYGGSTGYGREYRQRLNGNWGIVDVEDCVNAAQYLVKSKQADGDRLAITGGSAGGYTTLCALTFHDVFSAGASHFGVSDLEALALDTHKFESRYMDSMIGPYPQMKDVYRERSPIHFTSQLSCPLIVFQGLEDKVVPPNQAETIVDALREKGLPVAYVAFEGEQHGFRKAENIKRTLDGELDFYSRIFGFEPADKVEPVPIENL